MIKLTNLNQIITTLNGTPVADLSQNKTMTYKSALISICELHRPSNPGSGEALRAFDLGLKLLKAEDGLELEKKDIEFLKEIVERSAIFLSVVIGRLLHYLENAINAKVEKK